MNMRLAIGTGLTLAAMALGFSGSATAGQMLAALPRTSQPVVAQGDARPIAAWVDYCRRNPADCAVDRSEPELVTMSPKVWALLNGTTRRVNTAIQPMTDMEHWGVADRWDIPEDGFGDCEDYQLLKRKLLAEAGLPRRAMRMTVVIDEKNEGHAVLMVRTTIGDLVLDNKTDAVLPWFQTGYVFVKRESQDGMAWVSLGGAVSPAATATR